MENEFKNIELLVSKSKVDEAEIQLSKFGSEYHRNSDYLYLRSKIFYLKKLYYICIDTMLIALEFKEDDRYYELLSNVYNILGNTELSKKFLDSKIRLKAVNSLKDELSGIYREN